MDHYMMRCPDCGRRPKMKTVEHDGSFTCTVQCRKRMFKACKGPVFSAEAKTRDRAELYAATAWNEYMSSLEDQKC